MNIRKIILAIWAFVLPAMMYGQYTIQCEDTCNHVHGLDMSHYQGEVFWEAIGNNSKMAYVYLKATEGGTNIDKRYAQNIALAKQYGLKVGSYHFYRPTRPQVEQLRNFRYQCQAKDQDLIPMVDIETTGGLRREALLDSSISFSSSWSAPTTASPSSTPTRVSTTNTYRTSSTATCSSSPATPAPRPCCKTAARSSPGNTPARATSTASTAMLTRAGSWGGEA